MGKLIAWLKRPDLLERIWKKLLSIFFFEQWIILVAPKTTGVTIFWNNLKPIIPELDRIWADPFIWKQEDNYFVFFEEQFLSTMRGHISCITLDHKMQPISKAVVLDRPYHLSYPFLFEYESQLYMIPETKQNACIELYQCKHFPDQWEFFQKLIPNIVALDTTLLEANGKWWMFTNVEEKGGSSWDTLHLYYSDHPLTDQWKPHPKNPIVKDIQTARPAGRIFSRNGNLIRPSQDCSVRYGYALNFNRIITLTETEYEEVCEYSFKPPRFGKYIATHTWNEAGDLCVIDAQMWQSKFKRI